MDINQENINPLLDKYVVFVDEISEELHYSSNIKHLLYIIVPAFVIKYGINNESTILNSFKNVKIYIKNHGHFVTAAFNRSLKKDGLNYYTEKFITVNSFSNTSLAVILDNFVHEFNHAINSINNEIIVDDTYIKVRTGLATLNYDKKDMSFITKSKEVVLEELLNTAQTEEVINIIKSFSKYVINNSELSTTLYSLNKELGEKDYNSDAYQYQKYICENLINNKTFTPTINNLRFKGMIEDIPTLFDNVIGEEGSYIKLNKMLAEMHDLIIKYSEKRFFKNRYLNKIKSISSDVTRIIEDYEKKCIFK